MNISQYIGIPHRHHGRDMSGMDCYGLAMHIYKNELNICLPDFDYSERITPSDFLNIPFIEHGWTQSKDINKFNIIAFRSINCMGQLCLYLGNNISILTKHRTGSFIYKLKNARFKHLVGIYRWSGVK